MSKDKNHIKLTEEMTDGWLEEFLLPENFHRSKGDFQEDWDYVHKELRKKHMILRPLHKDYSQKVYAQNFIANA